MILVHGTQQQAETERDALAEALRDGMGLTLSPDKTRITDPAEGFQFLGHRVSMRWDDRFGWSPRIEVPKAKAADLRHKVKQLTTRQTLHWSLDDLLQKLNPILCRWAHFYCYCTGAKDVLGGLDWYVRDRVWRWMRKKHPEASVRWLLRHRRPSGHRPTRRVWRGERFEQYQIGWLKVQRYTRGWMTPPDFTVVPGEHPMPCRCAVFAEKRIGLQGERQRRDDRIRIGASAQR